MADLKYEPVAHDHDAFLEKARRRKGFNEEYDALEDEYLLVREMLTARARAGLTQEDVAASMGTTKSAISRLEAVSHSPSVSTLKKYAKAVGCDVEIRLVPEQAPRPEAASAEPSKRSLKANAGPTPQPL